MSPDAETGSRQASVFDVGMLLQIIKPGAAIVIELRDGGSCGIRETAVATVVVERDHCSRGFETMIYLRRCNYESVAGQSHRRSQCRSGELKNVGIEKNSGKLALATRRGYERSHFGSNGVYVEVLRCDLHVRA